jgi:hypothetical protein
MYGSGDMKKIYLFMDGETVTGWTDNISDNTVEIEVDDSHGVLKNPIAYKYINGELIRAEDVLLANMKTAKDRELNKACNDEILKGFSYTIDGEVYHFSYDMEAQINFGDSKEVLYDDNFPVTEVPFTAKDSNGKYVRILVNRELMRELTIAIFQHKAGSISKYRDELLPLVEQATTIEEVESINWNKDYSSTN